MAREMEEGHTPEAPAPDELGKKGTPAAGLTPRHAGEAEEHGVEPLGPIDWPAWAASALGVIIALLIVAALALPTPSS
ncbi:hypothetical protein BH24CHL8_BH24CHL8_06520 [soil metagenome]